MMILLPSGNDSSSSPPVRWAVDVDHVVLQPAVGLRFDAGQQRLRQGLVLAVAQAVGRRAGRRVAVHGR
jgi:hypothetical protein